MLGFRLASVGRGAVCSWPEGAGASARELNFRVFTLRTYTKTLPTVQDRGDPTPLEALADGGALAALDGGAAELWLLGGAMARWLAGAVRVARGHHQLRGGRVPLPVGSSLAEELVNPRVGRVAGISSFGCEQRRCRGVCRRSPAGAVTS